MPRVFLAACLLSLPICSGCALSDAIFCVFGDSYSAAGPSWDDKQRHYDAQVEASEAYAAANPPKPSDTSSSWQASALSASGD